MSQLLDVNLIRLSIGVMVPLVLAALGEVLTERAGVMNIAIEGIMGFGASVGFAAAFFLHVPALGFLCGAAAGAALALLLAALAISLRLDQITIGIALLVLGVGLGSILYRGLVGVRTAAPLVPTLPVLPIPGLASIPYLGPILFQHDLVTYLALLLFPVLSWLLFTTPLGLRIRASGENPRAADSLGVPVNLIRYASTVAGGALMGLAGAYLPLALTGGYSDTIVSGRGWIALMLVIFGRWRPWTVGAGCLLFAYVEALQFKVAILSKAVPPQLLLAAPYILAIIGLVSVYRSAKAPAALALPFSREART